MERKYKAFISYRHLPLQMDVAVRLHKYIEHYTIPRELRRDGQKHPGLVFRDQDELPLSGSLSDSITNALDNSEYLIVICTPETEQSKWVLREISYFIEKHGRDHVLTVIADGDESTSFPKILTEECDENGNLVNRFEPLAANIAAPGAASSNKLLKTEGLRLIAALIGCNYDDLYKREQRYKRRRTAAISSLAVLVAAVYASTVTVKNSQIKEQNVRITEQNAQIEEQLRQTQLNESKTLTQVSKSDLKDGDCYNAVKNAYDALPTGDSDRPYCIPAEEQLAEALGLYTAEEFVYSQSVEQDTDIYALKLSPDGKRLMTLDLLGTLRMFDCDTGKILWTEEVSEFRDAQRLGGFGYSSDGTQLMIFITSYGLNIPSELRVYDAVNGTILRSKSGIALRGGYLNLDLSDRYMAKSDSSYEIRDFLDDSIIADIPFVLHPSSPLAWAVSDSGRYFAVFEQQYSADSETYVLGLLLFDSSSGEVQNVSVNLPYDGYGDYDVAFCGDTPAVAFSGSSLVDGKKESVVLIYGSDTNGNWHEQSRTEFCSGRFHTRNGEIIATGDLHFFGPTNSESFFYCAKSHVCTIDAADGHIIAEKDIGSDVIDASSLNNRGSISIITYDGLLAFYSASGNLTSDSNTYHYETGQKVYRADVGGTIAMKSRYAFVFTSSKHRVSILRYINEIELEELYRFEDLYDNTQRLFISPDQSLLVTLSNRFADSIISGSLIDIENPDNSKEYAVELPGFDVSYLYDSDIYLTNDRKLYFNGLVLDIDTETVSFLHEPEPSYSGTVNNVSNYCKAAATDSGYGLTVSVLDNDSRTLAIHRGLEGKPEKIPFPDGAGETLHNEAVSPDGSTIVSEYSKTDGLQHLWIWYAAGSSWTDLDPDGILCGGEADSEYFALSDKGNIAALLTASNEIRLVSAANGAVLRSIPYSRSTVSVTRMLFVKNDSLLMVFDFYGLLSIYRTSDAKLLYTEDVSPRGLNYRAGSRVDVLQTSTGNRLVVIFDCNYYSLSSCLLIDTDSWERVGHYAGASAFLTKTDELILAPFAGFALTRAPLYSSEELIRMAEVYLEAHN